MVGSRNIAKALVLVLVPSALLGQTVRGLLTDRTSKLPVAGAIIQLIDSTGRAVSRSLSSERGEFWLSAGTAGTFRLRTLRIGFRPQVSDSVRLSVGEMIELPLPIASLPVSLDTVHVTGRNSCRATGDTVVATYAIWEQVRGALTAAQLTAASQELTANTMRYERVMDPTFRGVRKQSTAFGSSLTGSPWRSMRADSLRQFGYVLDDVKGARIYLAPDLDVLLSAEFLEDHCLRLNGVKSDVLIGIDFEPNKDRSKLPEIRGTVWVDRASAELRGMDFRYENLSVAESDARPGGQMEFLRLKSGAWVISRWSIRMPVMATVMEKSGSLSGVSQSQARVNEIRVAGGELVSVLKGDDTTWTRTPMAFSGEVIDSASRERLHGARISVRGTSISATTDKDGRFTMQNVLPGEYALDIRTASLDSVGATFATTAAFADGGARVRFNVPSGDHYASEFCPSAADSNKASALLLGYVRLEGDTTPPWNIAVTAQWQDGKETRSVLSRTDATGRYRMCGAPLSRDIVVRSELDDTAAAPARIRIPGRKRFAIANITVSQPATVVGSLFAGSVVTEWSREPLPDAEVTIPDLNISVRTNAQGRFRMAGVPAGTRRVTARKVGYSATEASIAFDGNTVTRDFALGGVVNLDTVNVRARPLLPDFEENRRLGVGQFLTRAQLAPQEGRRMSSVLATVPGLQLIPSGPNRTFPRSVLVPMVKDGAPPFGLNWDNVYCVGKQCGCYAQVYMDKMLLNPGRPTPAFDISTFSPDQIEAVEYYQSIATLPMQYARRGATCGVLVLHMRRSKL